MPRITAGSRQSATNRFANRDFDKSFVFDGSDDGVTLGVVPSTTNFNVAFWMYVNTATNNARIIDYQAGGPQDGFTMLLRTVPKTVDFVINNVLTEVARISAPYTLGKWTHIVATFATNSAKLYANTTLIGTDTSCTMSASTATLTLGKRATSAANFANITMDQFIFHNATPWTQAEINALYWSNTIPSGVNVIYNYNDDLTDSSGSGNNGTAAGSPLYSSNTPFSPRLTV